MLYPLSHQAPHPYGQVTCFLPTELYKIFYYHWGKENEKIHLTTQTCLKNVKIGFAFNVLTMNNEAPQVN